MTSAGNLTTLDAIKSWLEIDPANTDADVLLNRLNHAASAFVLNQLNRDSLALSPLVETYDGYGNTFMMLRRNPVYAVDAVSFQGVPISPASGDGFTTQYSSGWVLEPEYSITGTQRINLYGFRFPRTRGSVSVRYKSGFVITGEKQAVPAAVPYTIAPNFRCLGDVSVKRADGTLFTPVDGAPAAGQYSFNDGLYTFAAADANTSVFITYSFCPADIEQAVWELVGERYLYKDRIGVNSKSLGGQETVAFSTKSMSAYVKETLVRYANVTPI